MKSDVKDASKRIQKEIRAIAKARKTARVRKVLEEFKDLQRIDNIRCNGKTACIGSVVDKSGVVKTGADDIAEVFAEFFESLYKGNAGVFVHQGDADEIPAVTPEEIKRQLKRMLPRKAADGGGIVAEFLGNGSEMLMDILAEFFTAVMKPQTAVPDYWKVSSIKVLFKKGDQREPGNYRPICIIPILYKLFSKVLCARIKAELNAEQSMD